MLIIKNFHILSAAIIQACNHSLGMALWLYFSFSSDQGTSASVHLPCR